MLTSVRAKQFLLVVTAVGLFVAPLLFLVWLRSGLEDRLVEIDPPAQPLVITVERRMLVNEQLVNASLEWGRPPQVLAPNWSGTVTGVYVTNDDTLETGDPVLSIDGVDRIAASSDQPFWRFLGRGNSGADVSALQRLLSLLGYDVQPDGEFDASTQEAVKGLEATLGVAKPSGVFDPGWILWLPVEPFLVTSVVTTASSPAPSPGSAVLVGPPPLEGVTFFDNQDRPLALEGSWVFTSGGIEYSIVDGALDRGSQDRLEAATGPEVLSVSGRVRSRTPTEVIEIPATAVTSSADGTLCVWVPGPGGYSPRSVELGGGRIAQVFVVGGLSPGDQVLVNPAEILTGQACP